MDATARMRAAIGQLDGHARLRKVMNTQVYVLVWRNALEAQAERIRARSLDVFTPDMWLWACALGALLRCARLAEALGVDVSTAVANFDAAAPDAKKVRDVLEHLEEYELGIGRLQSPDDLPLEFMYQVGDDSIHLHMQGLDLELEYVAAQAAAAELAEVLVRGLQALREQLEAQHGAWRPPSRPDLEAFRL